MPILNPTRFYQPRGAFDPAPGGGSPTFTFRGKEGQFFNPATTATFTSIDIGTAAADRYIIVAICNQNGRVIDGVTVGGVSLTKDIEITPSRGLSIFSKLVTTGSGVQNIVATASTGGIFEDVTAFCWAGTGMSNTTGAAMTASAVTSTAKAVSVTAGDFLIGQFNIAASDSGSTQSPTVTRTQAGGGAAITTQTFEWNTIASTNASFNIGTSVSVDLVAAAYR